MPLAQFVKKTVETMAIKQGHNQLKFTIKQGDEPGNSDWIAGVDCDDTHENNQNNSSEDKDSDSEDEDCMPEVETDWE